MENIKFYRNLKITISHYKKIIIYYYILHSIRRKYLTMIALKQQNNNEIEKNGFIIFKFSSKK